MKNIKFLNNKIFKFLNLKNKTLDLDFLKKRKDFFSSPLNFSYINALILSKNSPIKFSSKKINSGIEFLLNNQKANGSFDEWYINENSFCATAYAGYRLSKIANFNGNLKLKIFSALNKIEKFLSRKNNFNNFNQELARFAFFSIYKNKYDKNYKKLILEKTSKYDDYEYDGLDLGYLSANLMILSDLLNYKFDKILLEIFKKQLNLFSHLSNGFNNFPNYLFSRSSRLILLSGFNYAYSINLINKNQFLKIYKKYLETLNCYIARKDKKYLSFFYSSDLANISLMKKINYRSKILSLSNSNKEKIKKNFFYKKLNNNLSISIYLKNANIFSINRKRIKYFFDLNINRLNTKYIPKKNERITVSKNFIFLKNSFVKSANSKNYTKYFKYVSPLNKFLKLGELFKNLGRYLIIKDTKVKQISYYKKIFFNNKKIKVQEILISKFNKISKKNIEDGKEQYYFSPTSFISKKELGKKMNEKIRTFKKLKNNILVREYEFN